MDDELTFAEALRQCGERGVVEVFEKGGRRWEEFWIDQLNGPHVNMDLTTVARFSESKFRRARPKRSRMYEMAQDTAVKPVEKAQCRYFGERVIRAVCEYLRKENIGPRSAMLPTGPGSAADAIELHFLEPRSPSE